MKKLVSKQGLKKAEELPNKGEGIAPLEVVAVQPESIIEKIVPLKMQKFIRQPDVELELDLTFSEIIKDYQRENDLLQKQIAENNKAYAKILGKVLKMNGLVLRPNTVPTFKTNSNILLVPVPDVLAPQK